MKKLNKKGFTLIELLAVIVVLAIIMVIAATQVGRAIKAARKGSFLSSYNMIVKEVKNRILQQGVNSSMQIECNDASACANLYDISKDDYDLNIYETNQGYNIKLKGKGKFSNLNINNSDLKDEDVLINKNYIATIVNQKGTTVKSNTQTNDNIISAMTDYMNKAINKEAVSGTGISETTLSLCKTGYKNVAIKFQSSSSYPPNIINFYNEDAYKSIAINNDYCYNTYPNNTVPSHNYIYACINVTTNKVDTRNGLSDSISTSYTCHNKAYLN